MASGFGFLGWINCGCLQSNWNLIADVSNSIKVYWLNRILNQSIKPESQEAECWKTVFNGWLLLIQLINPHSSIKLQFGFISGNESNFSLLNELAGLNKLKSTANSQLKLRQFHQSISEVCLLVWLIAGNSFLFQKFQK